MRASFFLSLILIFVLAACAQPKGTSAAKNGSQTFGSPQENTRPTFKPETTFVEMDWSPSSVEVSCAAERCPLQVGALIFAGEPVAGMIPTRRCTAFLVSGDTIVSNGHCDGFGKAKGYFITQKINGSAEVRSVTAVPFKRFTPDARGEKFSSGKPDVAMFTLNKAVRGLAPLRLASGPQIIFSKLTVFAIMNSPSETKLTIRSQDCFIRRHGAEFPFEMSESPDMIQSYGCRLEPGTSGAPMFAPGSEDVQAVQVGGVDPQQRAALVREKLRRDLFIYEKHWSSVSTNVRCFDFPGAKPVACTVTGEAVITQRFEAAQASEMAKLKARRVSPSVNFRLRPYDYQLRSSDQARFEVIHIPECKVSKERPASVPFIIEQVKIEFDEWAQPRIASMSQVLVNAGVKSVSPGGAHELEIAWPEPAGVYFSPHLGPRKKMGSRFHIDLPVCPG